MSLMASYNPPPSDGHPPQPSPAVNESQQISVELAPLVKQINNIIDRLERLAGLEEGERKDGDADR